MECAAVPLAGLSTGHQVGLAVVGAVFIAFALVSALVIPRWKPEFPGRARGLYILLVVALFVGMMSAVFIFGKESKESEASEEPTTETTAGPTTTAEGNPTAGKAVFDSAGCSGCHTFKPAGATQTTGPNLDQVLKGKSAEFIRVSILAPNAEIAKGYQANIMPQNFRQQLSDKQLNDLIAFLESG